MKLPVGTSVSKLRLKTIPFLLNARVFITLGRLFIVFCIPLDNSIAWNRSALNANCRICRRRGDPESMLLCDMCNKGHHMYCLKPKLTVSKLVTLFHTNNIVDSWHFFCLQKVPKGDWFCPYCKPPVKEPSQKKKHVYVMESDEEMDRKSPIQMYVNLIS